MDDPEPTHPWLSAALGFTMFSIVLIGNAIAAVVIGLGRIAEAYMKDPRDWEPLETVADVIVLGGYAACLIGAFLIVMPWARFARERKPRVEVKEKEPEEVDPHAITIPAFLLEPEKNVVVGLVPFSVLMVLGVLIGVGSTAILWSLLSFMVGEVNLPGGSDTAPRWAFERIVMFVMLGTGAAATGMIGFAWGRYWPLPKAVPASAVK